MKIGLFLGWLCCLTTSCQSNYSEDFMAQNSRINEQLESSSQLVKKHTLEVMEQARIMIQKMPHSKIMGSKIQEVVQLTNHFYNEIEVLKTPFNDNYQKQQYAKIFETLSHKVQDFQQQWIQLVEVCWDKGGIKGTVFADMSKKKASLQRLKKDLGTTTFEQLKANTFFHNKEQPLSVVLTLLHTLQNDIRRQENSLVGFFASQIPLYCGYDRFDLYASSQKTCIRLGETYEAGICFGSYAPISLLSISVDKDSIPIVDNRANYQIKPKTTGEQGYKASVTFQNSTSEAIEHQEQLFYFEVSL